MPLSVHRPSLYCRNESFVRIQGGPKILRVRKKGREKKRNKYLVEVSRGTVVSQAKYSYQQEKLHKYIDPYNS